LGGDGFRMVVEAASCKGVGDGDRRVIGSVWTRSNFASVASEVGCRLAQLIH
jgi:hypothetical protein